MKEKQFQKQRREFLRMGSVSVLALLGGSGLISCGGPSGPDDPSLPVEIPPARDRKTSTSMVYYITDGFVTQADGVPVYFKGFSRTGDSLTVPGEFFLVTEGETITITVHNTLGVDHSFVIDGLVDSGVIRAGESVELNFVAGAPGSYLFYDKLNAPYNRLIGLHGAMGILPAGSDDELYSGSPQFMQQYYWVFNDIDPLWHEEIRNGATPTSEFIPRYFTINGLSGRPPGSADYSDATLNAMKNLEVALRGSVGDRALIRVFNAGLCSHAVHWHGNHVEWLSKDGVIRPDVWKKDALYLSGSMGRLDVIFPFESPPDAYPPTRTGEYPMHLHDEMTQTAGGGNYMFGALTDIYFE